MLDELYMKIIDKIIPQLFALTIEPDNALGLYVLVLQAAAEEQ